MKFKAKHGAAIGDPKSYSRKYKTWRKLKQRCNDNTPGNGYYGMLYEPWQDYEVFAEYMPEPPCENITIDRIDNSQGYIPGNVRWATWTEQHRNQTNCRWIEFNGETKLLIDWAREIGITASSLLGRLESWSLEEALTIPKKGKRK